MVLDDVGSVYVGVYMDFWMCGWWVGVWVVWMYGYVNNVGM